MINEENRLIDDLIDYMASKGALKISETKKDLLSITSKYYIKGHSNDEEHPDLKDNIALFLSAKKIEGLSELTLYGYKLELSILSKGIKKKTSKISTDDIRIFLSSFPELKMSSLSRKLSVLKSFFKWLTEEEIILRDPSTRIKSPKQEKRLPKGMSVEELELVRESCKTLRQRALVEVLYSTGCRLSEIANMNISDVNVQDMSIKVIGKGNKERIVYLTFKALYHLKKYLNSRNDEVEALFITERKPYRKMSNRTIQREVDMIEKHSKIPRNITPHVFRHSTAQGLLDNGADLSDVQHILGHENPSTTLMYGHISEERKRNAHKRYLTQ